MSDATPTVLERILAETREGLEARRDKPLPERPTAKTSRGARPFCDALAAPGIGVIAEFKRRSPSAGSFHEAPDLERIVSAYERGGAVAASILTEGPNFGGSLEDLRSARAACGLPLLRKDFIVDSFQLHEAWAAGADAVLLIVAALSQTELSSLNKEAREIGLDVLVEVHDEQELLRALEVGAEIIGINNRDLRDFSVDVERTASLMDKVASKVIVVSESGIGSSDQLARLQEQGVQAVLVGETLMRAEDPTAALLELRSSPARFRNSLADL